MKTLLSYFENFAFRYINFWDRASPAEYWVVMPVIWALIILAFVFDVSEFWSFLLAREIPPMNPLYYESLVLFVLTAVPRLSLTARRLHDTGKSAKWAFLPVISIISGLILMLGLGSAMVSSSMESLAVAAGSALAITAIVAAIAAGHTDIVWEAAFSTAAALNAVGWDAVWAVFAEARSNAATPQVGAAVGSLVEGVKEDPALGGSLMLSMILTVGTPFIAAFMHLFFMLLPSDMHDNSYGQSNARPITGGPARKPKRQEELLASYACLFEQSAEQQAAAREANKAELKELYRSRVLGQADKPA